MDNSTSIRLFIARYFFDFIRKLIGKKNYCAFWNCLHGSKWAIVDGDRSLEDYYVKVCSHHIGNFLEGVYDGDPINATRRIYVYPIPEEK